MLLKISVVMSAARRADRQSLCYYIDNVKGCGDQTFAILASAFKPIGLGGHTYTSMVLGNNLAGLSNSRSWVDFSMLHCRMFSSTLENRM